MHFPRFSVRRLWPPTISPGNSVILAVRRKIAAYTHDTGKLELEDCVFLQCHSAINLFKTSSLIARRCLISESGHAGSSAVWASGSTTLLLEDCTFERCVGLSAVWAKRASTDTETLSGLCTIRNCSVSSSTMTGILIYGTVCKILPPERSFEKLILWIQISKLSLRDASSSATLLESTVRPNSRFRLLLTVCITQPVSARRRKENPCGSSIVRCLITTPTEYSCIKVRTLRSLERRSSGIRAWGSTYLQILPELFMTTRSMET